MRSSLRKTNYSSGSVSGSGRSWNSSSAGGGSGGGTPTNPTPPDSMNSEDSSYASAKDSSHSTVSALRVRFSPVAASVSEDGRTLLDIPVHGQSQDCTIPLKVYRSSFPRCKTRHKCRRSKFLHTIRCNCVQAARQFRFDYSPGSYPASRSSKSTLSELEREFL